MPYQVIASHTEPGREERLLPAPPWVLGGPAGPMIRALSPGGQLYRHQSLALGRLGEGKNLIVSTGPASGKTLVFQAGTMDRLAQDPEATALAVYPMRALAHDQLGRWRAAAQQTGVDPGGVRRIDEDTEIRERSGELREARLALMTPDTVQSWLLSYADGNTRTRSEGVNRAKTVCRDFIRRLAVIVIDEAHVYEEAFGANMAYLLRRLRAKRQELAPGAEPLIIAAGAPITNPAGHMRKLTGLPFAEVTEADNGSPRAPLTVQHASGRSRGAGSEEDMVLLIGELMREDPSGSCVVFTGDRQRAGRIAAGVEPAGAMLGDGATGEPIEGKIRPGGTGGVVSAGALEMGIDIPGFTVGISLGLAPSIQRMKQRAGRARGGNPGRFIIMDKPHAFQFDEDGLAGYWNRPPGAAQLHLTNRRLQRMHAECLRAERDQQGAAPEMEWPEGFSDILMDTAGGGAPEKPAMSRQDPPAQKQYPHSHSVRDIADRDFDVILEGDGRRIAQMPKTRAMRDLYTWAAYRHGKQVYRVTAWHENGTEENGNPHIMVAPSRSQGRTEGITVTGAAADLAGAETREGQRGMAAYLDGAHATGRLAVIGCRTLEPDERGEAGWTERLYSGQPGTPDIRRSTPTTAALVRIGEPWFENPTTRRAVIEALRDIMCHLENIDRDNLMTAHENIRLAVDGEETPADDAVMLWDRAYGGLGLSRALYENLPRYTARLLQIARDPSRGADLPIPLITARLLDRWASGLADGRGAEQPGPEDQGPENQGPEDWEDENSENEDWEDEDEEQGEHPAGSTEETEHAGTVFRSRLSAGWAAWFDWKGIPWEYEPAAFGDWSPDFRIRAGQETRYVQVAPVDGFPREAAEWINTSPWAGTAMIAGRGPGHVWVRERGRWRALQAGEL